MAKSPFVLVITEDLTAVSAPLKSTQRIKYTCFDVSENFIVLGASSGGLYVFQRNPCAFLQLLPNKDGAITHVAVSPNERFFAFASVKGVVCVLELNDGPGARRLLVSTEHLDREVSVLLWNTRSDELFAGDDEGRVSVVTVSLFSAKPMFPVPPFQLMQLDSRVVQMDWFAELLLVSTLTRSYLCDTVKEQYRQIGHKPREGEFGACFHAPVGGVEPRGSGPRIGAADRSGYTSVGVAEEPPGSEGLQDVRLYCARPGSRLWEVNVHGTVLRTHQFKDALAIPPAPVVNLVGSDGPGSHTSASPDESRSCSWNPQSFNFPRLHNVYKNYLMTFRQSGVYIFDPEVASVVLWSDAVEDIVDAKVVKETVYLYTSSGDVRALTLFSIEDFVVKLYFWKKYSLCADLCLAHMDHLLSHVTVLPKLCILSDLARKVEDLDLVEKISPLLEAVSKLYNDKRNCVKLESGIVIIGNQYYLAKEDENQLRQRLATLVKENTSKEKSRSLNTSPKMLRRGSAVTELAKLNKNGSTSSLPELLQNSNSGSTRTLSDDEHNAFNSPEARKVLKDIGQSMSGKLVNSKKTLIEKWQILENKMKGLGSNPNVKLIGIKPQNHPEYDADQLDPQDENTEDIVYQKCVHRFPVLDLDPLIKTCQEIQNSDMKKSTEKGTKFFYCVKSLSNEFKEKSRPCENDFISSMSPEIGKCSHSKLINNTTLKNFPFYHYFHGDSLQLVCSTLHKLFQFQFVIDFVQTLECEELLPVPDQLLRIHKLTELELDAKMCQFLHSYSDIIDSNIMVQNIKRLNLPCYYKSLVALLDIYQRGKQLQVEEVEDEKGLMMQLSVILMMLRMDQIETCSKMGEALDLKDVFYLILRVQEMSVESGVDASKAKRDSHRMFLSFLDKSVVCDEAVLSALNDSELSAFLIAAYEDLNSNVAYSCQCGYPAPQPPEPQFLSIGRLILGHLLTVGSSCIKKFLHRIPGMWSCYLDLKTDSPGLSDLPLILHLGDVSLLEGVLPQTATEQWADVLDMFAKFSSGRCLNCKKPATWTARGGGISWSLLGSQAVKHLGPGSALEHLAKYADCLGPGELDARFFQSCIFSVIVDKHATGLRDKVVDMVLDTSGKKNTKALMSQEVGQALAEALQQDTEVRPAPAGPQRGDHHWGVGVDLEAGRCPICWLPLGSAVLLQDGGLVVFRCGHACHSVCLEQRAISPPACLLCDRL
ncbi:uncharacterized protein LOC134530606 [Bacillus rossius redtenbacheri]|uniref:uncharacterized protein LOC134530606 n=1 Tax=Bacillus rossius redtenbacheri TaxID=93214 RepID=UPI002FDDB64E